MQTSRCVFDDSRRVCSVFLSLLRYVRLFVFAIRSLVYNSARRVIEVRVTRMEKSVARENHITKVLTIAIFVRASPWLTAPMQSASVAFHVEDIVIRGRN